MIERITDILLRNAHINQDIPNSSRKKLKRSLQTPDNIDNSNPIMQSMPNLKWGRLLNQDQPGGGRKYQ